MTLDESIRHWDRIAVEADEHAAYLEGRGEHAGAWRAKAESYRRAAESLRIESRTGVPHCSCCFKPLGVRS